MSTSGDPYDEAFPQSRGGGTPGELYDEPYDDDPYSERRQTDTPPDFRDAAPRHPHRIGRKPLIIITASLACIAVLAGVLFWIFRSSPPPPPPAANSVFISYAGATSWLTELGPAEAGAGGEQGDKAKEKGKREQRAKDEEEQLRDWARLGLASHLELGTEQLRDAAYDTMPVRDPVFADVVRQPTGPGRSLFDGRTLHLLIPFDDPHENRTIGLLLDQHRIDAGSDPAMVQIHHYRFHRDVYAIELTSGDPKPADAVRTEHGYVTMSVGDTGGLTEFLTKARHLSGLEMRGSEIWAGGWNWPDPSAAPLDVADVAAIQRGYLKASSAQSPVSLPGFSLDPSKLAAVKDGKPAALTEEDISSVVPELSPELRGRIVGDNWRGSPFQSVGALADSVHRILFYDKTKDKPPPPLVGLPRSRTQLWALLNLLERKPVYSQARYEGGLKGTEVGMTLFYTDHMAKNWSNGVGAGLPEAVRGFVPSPAAETPWGHCPTKPREESGRLWFGQNEPGFDSSDDRVSIGAQATRLFVRSNAEPTDESIGTPVGERKNREVEPSFAFGRGLRWWDQNYQAIADYEPQYQRLEQIMRWSGALEWLVSKKATLRLDDVSIRHDLRFAEWYKDKPGHQEKTEIKFVTPPSAKQENPPAEPSTAAAKNGYTTAYGESLLPEPSKPYDDCGFQWVAGGVSLADRINRMNLQGGREHFQADIPAGIRRGGPVDETSGFDRTSGTGRITERSIDEPSDKIFVERTLSRTADGDALVSVRANGRNEITLGRAKVVQGMKTDRTLGLEIKAGRGDVRQGVEVQGQTLGLMVTRKQAGTITIQWSQGPLARAVRAVESVQKRLKSWRSSEPPPPAEGVLYRAEDGNGHTLDYLGGPEKSWLSVTTEAISPGGDVTFRLGGLKPEGGDPQFYLAGLLAGRGPPPIDSGPPRWVSFLPGDHGQPARPTFLAALPHNTHTVKVETPDGSIGIVHECGGRACARINDPIMKSDVGITFLRNYHLAAVAKARAEGARLGDGMFQAVSLGEEGVALFGADSVMLRGSDHPWYERVRRAALSDPSRQTQTMLVEGGLALHLSPDRFKDVDPRSKVMDLSEALDSGQPVYVHHPQFRSRLLFEDSPVFRPDVPHNLRVRVREAIDPTSALIPTLQPDGRVHADTPWVRIGRVPPRPPVTSNPTETPVPPGGAGGAGGAGGIVPSPITASPSILATAGFGIAAGTIMTSGRVLLVCPDEDGIPGCED